MKRPQKVTKETRLNQYARKMYGKEKIEKNLEMEELDVHAPGGLSGKKGAKKKIRTQLNRKLRHSHKMKEIADGGAYRKETSWEE